MRKILIFLTLLITTACASNPGDTPLPSASAPKKVILALGDSLTAGLGVSDDGNYPSQMEAKLTKLGYNYMVQNAGVSGDTSAGLLSRMDWILDGDTASLAILCIGANDAFQGKSVEDIEKNIRSIIEKIRNKNIPILFAGMKAPLNLGGEYGDQYASMFDRIAKEYKLPFIPFFLDGVALDPKLNQEDRIHPTASGYTIVVEHLVQKLEDEKLIIKE